MSAKTVRRFGAVGLAAASVLLSACGPTSDPRLARYETDERTTNQRLVTFDDLDFNVYTNQKWNELSRSHAADITVFYPDGSQTKGIAAHVEQLKPMFVFAPDTRIQTHPVKFGSGEWTSVIGVIEGTFTKPMPTPDGKPIAPTGKPFKLTMCTVGHWRDGVMDEEYLFWDNQALMKQIGLAP